MKDKLWTKVLDVTGEHRFFRDQDGNIAVADRSGGLPEFTDDGVLYVDESYGIRVGDEGCGLRTQCGHGVGLSAREALLVAMTFGWPVRVVNDPKGTVLKVVRA